MGIFSFRKKPEVVAPAAPENKGSDLEKKVDESSKSEFVHVVHNAPSTYNPDVLAYMDRVVDKEKRIIGVYFITGARSGEVIEMPYSDIKNMSESVKGEAWKGNKKVMADSNYKRFLKHPERLIGIYSKLLDVVVNARDKKS